MASVFPRIARIGLAALAVGIAAEAAGQESGRPPRLAPRPPRTEQQRGEWAATLRDRYKQPAASWPAPHIDPGVEWREIGPLPPAPHPAGNPASAAKAALGRLLFFDARLSSGAKMSCASCHEPNLGWADGRSVSQPHGRSPDRNTPTIRNVAFQPALFWDGRASSLEQQVEAALTNPLEMAADRDRVVRLLESSDDYRRLFAAAFPGRLLDFGAVVDAVASFERTVVGGRSRFDAFSRGDTAALSDTEIIGLDLFRREGRCMNCHHGPVFSDGRFHDLGLSFHGRGMEDLGRYTITRDPADKGRFRTPSLRDVTATSPLMHNGLFELRGVLNMYNAGMVTLKRQPFERDDPAFPVKSPLLKPLGLNRQDLDDLAAFLATLEEPRQLVRPPELPRVEEQPVSGPP